MDNRLQGGMVTNVGQYDDDDAISDDYGIAWSERSRYLGADGGLTMVLAGYQAAVECRGTFRPRESCSTIMDDMETARDSETFGPNGDPATQVPLPMIMRASE